MKKNSGFSVVRLGLIAGGIGIALVIFGIIAFLGDQAARRVPFNITPYEGAEEWGTANATLSSRSLLFRVSDATPEQVAEYYQQKLNDHYGDNRERCVRIPPTGEYPIAQNAAFAIPYQYRCVFDNSGFQTTQYTTVLIYPGYYHPDADINSEGMTIIEYQQRWSP